MNAHRCFLAPAMLLALCLAGCSSSSAAGTPDAEPLDAGQPDHHVKDAAAPGHDGAHDAAVDAPTVCSPLFGVDAGKGHDAALDGHEDRGAADAAVDAPVAVDGPPPPADAAIQDAAGDAPDGDATPPSCLQACAEKNAAAYQAFERHQVEECGCVADGDCYAACHTSTSLAPGGACGACLAAQTAEGLSSECTLAAAHDCAEDTACTAYQSCAGACPM